MTILKKKYSILQNIAFTHTYILEEFQARYWMAAAVIILGTIAATFMLTYLPAYAVALLTNPGGIGGILFNITVYSLLLCAVSVLYKRIQRNTDKAVVNRRLKKGQEYYVTILQTNYENIDTSKYKAYFNAGLESYYDGPHTGFHHIITDFRTLLLSVAGLIVYVVFIAKISIFISLFLLIVSAFSIFTNLFNEKWITKHQDEWLNLNTKLNYLTRESIALKNAKDIRLYPIKDWFTDTYHFLTGLRLNWYKKELRLMYVVNISERLLTALKYAVAYFIVFENVKHGLGVNDFILFIGLILGVNQWVTGIFENVKYLQLNSIHVGNSRRVLDLSAASGCSTDRQKSSPGPVPAASPEIRMEDVCFTFPESNIELLKHFNLTISAGEKLAIVGNNGAGKSTLIKLICGLYKPTSGKILLNGVDVQTLSREEIYRYFSVVFQDFNLLAATVAENVSCCLKEKTDLHRVSACIRMAGLEEKIASLPKGLDTTLLKELDPEGVLLSGGEKQKLMIARCLYNDGPVLILDEPTSALDAIAESEIYAKYSGLTQGKTSIFISHRLSSTKFCDRIILLDHGSIIEEGTHGQLLKKNGKYADMYAIQSSYYNEEQTCDENDK